MILRSLMDDHGVNWREKLDTIFFSTDKQQKGEFSIDGYIVKLNHTLRKDSKKECCFEISANDKRVYQVGRIRPVFIIHRLKKLKYLKLSI